MFKRIIFFALLTIVTDTYGQLPDKEIPVFSQVEDPSNKALIKKYFSGSISKETGMRELFQSAREDELSGNTASATQKLQLALKVYTTIDDTSSLTYTMYTRLGSFLTGIGAHELGMGNYKNAYRVFVQSGAPPDIEIYHLLGRIGTVYLEDKRFDSSALYLHRALKVAGHIRPPYLSSAFNNLGMLFNGMKQYDSARYYLDEALAKNNASDTEELKLRCSILDNFAVLYDGINAPQRAVACYREIDSLAYITKDTERLLRNTLSLIRIKQKYNIGDIDNDITFIEGLLPSFASRNPRLRIELYKLLNSFYFNKKQYEHAQRYVMLFIRIKDSLDEIQADSKETLVAASALAQVNNFEREMDVYKNKADAFHQKANFNIKLFITIGIGAVVISLLLVFYLRNRTALHRDHAQLAALSIKYQELENEALRQQLELRKKDLTGVVLQNTSFVENNQQLIQRLGDILKSKDTVSEIKSLISDLRSKNQVDERSVVFQHHIEHVNTEFYDKLLQRFPDLTKGEVELCGFIRMNMSGKEIAVQKNIEYNSVKIAKKRLRKKLNLPEGEDVSRFLHAL